MFEGRYANFYDLFHFSKNYQMEVKSIINLLQPENMNSLKGFDYGCGTGSHAIAFLEHGICVDGYDQSEDMISIARAKTSHLKFSSNYRDFSGSYDFTYSLFDVLSYQITEEGAKHLINRLFEKSVSGGITLVDSWNRDGVKLSPPLSNSRSVQTPDGEIIRKVSPRKVVRDNIYELDISLVFTSTNEVLQKSVHSLRAWSPDEVIEMMAEIGYKHFKIYNPASVDAKPKRDDWRFGIRAKKV